MEKLRLNEEQSPVIDKEKLLIESQNREINRLFSSMETEFNTQAWIIYDFVKKESLSWIGNKVYEAIWNEMDRISKLPTEKQAQAIWEIA